jgi:hypothetical protein
MAGPVVTAAAALRATAWASEATRAQRTRSDRRDVWAVAAADSGPGAPENLVPSRLVLSKFAMGSLSCRIVD